MDTASTLPSEALRRLENGRSPHPKMEARPRGARPGREYRTPDFRVLHPAL